MCYYDLVILTRLPSCTIASSLVFLLARYPSLGTVTECCGTYLLRLPDCSEVKSLHGADFSAFLCHVCPRLVLLKL
jgi:hypothetical protein